VTLDELDHTLPNGFHDAHILSFALDYVAGVATFHLNLLVGWPDDPEPEREAYQQATLIVRGLCFCSIDPPDSTYPFLPDEKPIRIAGAMAKPDFPPFTPELVAKFPADTWCYCFFVDNWNAYINIAGRDTELTWIGKKPKHA
jgi:hypothetical protein